jgi:hypothetical protein
VSRDAGLVCGFRKASPACDVLVMMNNLTFEDT